MFRHGGRDHRTGWRCQRLESWRSCLRQFLWTPPRWYNHCDYQHLSWWPSTRRSDPISNFSCTCMRSSPILHLLYDRNILVSRQGTWTLQLRRSLYATVCDLHCLQHVLYLDGYPGVLPWLHITLSLVQCLSRQAILFSFSALVAYPRMYISVTIFTSVYPLYYSWALQFAVASGATVIATSSSDEKLKVAAGLGAEYLINYKKTPNWDEEVLKIVCIYGFVTKLLNSSVFTLDKWSGCGSRHWGSCNQCRGWAEFWNHELQVGGEGTLSRSMKSVRVSGYIHIIGFISKVRISNDRLQRTPALTYEKSCRMRMMLKLPSARSEKLSLWEEY